MWGSWSYWALGQGAMVGGWGTKANRLPVAMWVWCICLTAHLTCH